MVFPLQQAATDLDRKETSLFTRPESFPIPAEKTMKGSVACEGTTGVLYLFERARWSLAFAEEACLSPSFWYLCVIP